MRAATVRAGLTPEMLPIAPITGPAEASPRAPDWLLIEITVARTLGSRPSLIQVR
jgi:hypothetical protein